ncbi:hypothetical protein HHK36_024372 [Tetracentron sinense]|uniref:Transcription initiation factor TFIID subunit 10 n=1 Tax=Tetracentron sinense TaxID=13715 RepID=A0A834YKS2_TETSI|nr:hypothetical protein HHK36_024372 [Tetracentron sinense]
MNHNHSSGEGRHDDDSALSDFLASLMDYTPTIPDELVEHYIAKSGFQCPDVRLIRLVAVATQKFIAEVASDALQQCKARQSAIVKDKRDKQQKDKRLILTMDDLSKALREVTAAIKVIGPKMYETPDRLGSSDFPSVRTYVKDLALYGVNVKHQEYFADSPSTGVEPASRDE